jgi:hypothetical protein
MMMMNFTVGLLKSGFRCKCTIFLITSVWIKSILSMRDADAWLDPWNQLSSYEKYERVGQYLQWKMSPTCTMRPLTRREVGVVQSKNFIR